MTASARRWLILRRLAIVAIAIATIWLNAVILTEAYGDGPPYYGRTSNMDKWSSPLPWLVPADLAVIVVLLLIVRWNRRRQD